MQYKYLPSIECDSMRTEISLDEGNLLIESCVSDFFIASKEIELAYGENDPNHMNLLIEKAKENTGNKIKNALIALKDKIKDFFKALISKVRSFLSSDKYDTSLNKIEGRLKNNPKLNNKKVKIRDYKKIDSEYAKTHKEIALLMSKAKRGKCSLSDLESLASRHKKRIAVAAASSALVTAGAAYLFSKSYANKIEAKYKDELQSVIDIYDTGIEYSTPDGTKDFEKVSAMTKLAKLKYDITKEQATHEATIVSNVLSTINRFLAREKSSENDNIVDYSLKHINKSKNKKK